MVVRIISIIAYLVLAPIIGCILAGLDRKMSARMQRRVGPPILQPYYDVRKLFENVVGKFACAVKVNLLRLLRPLLGVRGKGGVVQVARLRTFEHQVVA